jgi:hypothetical protein
MKGHLRASFGRKKDIKTLQGDRERWPSECNQGTRDSGYLSG